jgi:hypothetical protein
MQKSSDLLERAKGDVAGAYNYVADTTSSLLHKVGLTGEGNAGSIGEKAAKAAEHEK